MSQHHHQLKTFHHCQLSLEVKLFIMAIETLTSLVQVYDSNPTVSLPTSHMGLCDVMWVSDSHLCVTFSSCYLLYMEKQEGCGEGPQLRCLTTFHRAPYSQHHNSRLLSYPYTVLGMLLFSFLFNHWAFAHATSSAWKTLAFGQASSSILQDVSRRFFCFRLYGPVRLLLQRHHSVFKSLWFEYLFS